MERLVLECTKPPNSFLFRTESSWRGKSERMQYSCGVALEALRACVFLNPVSSCNRVRTTVRNFAARQACALASCMMTAPPSGQRYESNMICTRESFMDSFNAYAVLGFARQPGKRSRIIELNTDARFNIATLKERNLETDMRAASTRYV